MTILTAVMILAMLATVIALGMGVVSMAHGGEFDKKHSEQFMFARISLQGLTLVLLLIAVIVSAMS
ncbi:MAG: twin transmembrane helix small protein [Gammaproteobacteria bacterium]|nr:twin transmembrane helix small protein [Gammaproteobacteria bacterium]